MRKQHVHPARRVTPRTHEEYTRFLAREDTRRWWSILLVGSFWTCVLAVALLHCFGCGGEAPTGPLDSYDSDPNASHTSTVAREVGCYFDFAAQTSCCVHEDLTVACAGEDD